MPEGDKTTQQGAPASSPAPVSGITGTPAPTGLGADGGGQQAPASAGIADAPQQGQEGSPQQAKGAPWTRDEREDHYQTLYQKQKAELDAFKALGENPDQLAARLKAQQETPRQQAPQSVSTDAPSGDPALTVLWNQCARSAYDTYLSEVQSTHGMTMALQEAQRLGVLKTQTPMAAQPQQAVPNIADLETRMEQIANRTVRSSHTRGYDFQKRLNNFATPFGGGQFLQAEITVETPRGQIKMTREEAVHKYNDWANDQGRPVQDIREIFREVDPAGLREIEKRQLRQEVWTEIQQNQASGQVVVGQGGVPRDVQPGMASPNAALHEGLTQTAVASDRFGLNSLTKPKF